MKITLVVGTRPNFVKISQIVDTIIKKNKEGKNIEYRLVHTGQHFDKLMSGNFFEELQIPKPNVNLNCSGNTQTEIITSIMNSFEIELQNNKPDLVLVVGDVNSTMACALVTKKLGIDVAHVEAGIRSFDRTMPEEINRLVTDSISDYFFTTSRFANKNLKKENINKKDIFFVGNTMIDTLVKNLSRIKKPENIDDKIIVKNNYFLMTLHRPSNVDNDVKLFSILKNIDSYVKNIPVIFPVHPRTKKNIDKFNFKLNNIFLVNPQNYLEFIYLIKNSLGVITDSGGITEETSFLNVPCITLRNNTERPETIKYGTNILVGDDIKKLKLSINKIINKKWKKVKNLELWDGKTSERIINHIIDIYNIKTNKSKNNDN